MADSPPTPTTVTTDPARARLARMARLAALLALAALAIGLLFFMPARPTEGRWRELRGELMDWTHLPFFLGGALGLYLLWPWWRERPQRRLLATMTLAATSAAAVEVIQPMFGRSGTWVDLLNGWLGIGLATLLVVAWRRPRRWRLGALAGLLLIGLLRLGPTVQEWRARQLQIAEFPVLGAFESPLELRLWQAQGADPGTPGAPHIERLPSPRDKEEFALAVSGGSGEWPGIYYLASDMDWSAYSELALSIHNPGPAFELTYRLDDQAIASGPGGPVSRYHGALQIAPGWNHLRIDLRHLGAQSGGQGGAPPADLRAVRRLVFFRAATLPDFVLDDVRLQ